MKFAEFAKQMIRDDFEENYLESFYKTITKFDPLTEDWY
jgi:hypothetical protein